LYNRKEKCSIRVRVVMTVEEKDRKKINGSLQQHSFGLRGLIIDRLPSLLRIWDCNSPEDMGLVE
jgi:hypothetical protein